ncbi:helix-turn-helix domain-containing protein [Ktedonosporobacter rubrisoli]|uniref:Helix-turn-helix domain-containing protein n=1 Tax=Ktedonosporobacter rubrisoli TaxID=2509675 RepID=A0A4P6JU15_KTERU|nr:tetratricopeptide repeat protein [Ktedonosporobacter rubrisoli]QBD78944.1 helix-turn-helix domain-containing protein [Ktedonosporobacter rubrisoli]
MRTSKTTDQPRLRLTEARKNRGWSQKELADLIETTHVNISRWERGITRPSPFFRRKLSKLFGKTEEELDLHITQGNEGEEEPERTAEPAAGASQAAVASTPEARSTPTETPGYALPKPIYDPAIPLRPEIRLVGRDTDLSQLRARLRAGGSVALTALNGLPGVGKTALAIALAHDEEIRVQFRDGVLWAGLGPTPNISGLLRRWGSLLGISVSEIEANQSDEAWTKALRNAIGERHMLLVIDDAWEVEDALTFKVGGPNCAHLVTTRFPAIAAYVSVDGAAIIHELNEEESMALLRMLAPGVVEHESQRAGELVQAVGGLPLALTLMGNYLRKQAYTGQVRRITTALQRLSDAHERLSISEPRALVDLHPSLPGETQLSLQSVLAVTDQQLDEQTRAALYALAVFPPKPNSFSEEAALAVASCPVEAIDVLTDSGLLESNGTGRYTLHQIVADYARLHLNDPQAPIRLIEYMTNFVEQHRKDYELLELESNTILAALESAHTLEKRSELVRGVIGFAPFLLLRALYPQAEHFLQLAHEAASVLNDERGLASLLMYQGEVIQRQGDYARAETRFQDGLTLARKIYDKGLICTLLTDIGSLTWKRGEYTQAEAYLQEGLTLAHELNDKERICGLLRILGSVAANRGDYAQSEAYLQEGLTFARQIGDRELACILLSNLGATIGEQGKFAQAEIYFQEGLELARQIGHRERICILLGNLGEAYYELKNYPQAEIYFQEGLLLARQIGHREWISISLLNLGMVTHKQGHHKQAETYLQESLLLARRLGRPRITCSTLNEYGKLHLDQAQLELAEENFLEMKTLVSEGDQELLSLANYGLARIAAARGDLQEAHKLGRASADALTSIGHHSAQEVREWLNSIQA